MSASHNDSAHSAPDPVEYTTPMLWMVFLLLASLLLVWWFFHWFAAGQVDGRRGDPIPKAVAAHAEVEPDHKKLSALRTPDVLDEGATVYAKNCASCHGANGDNPPGANHPRDFSTEAFRNPLGGGPFALYEVVSNGFNNQMPAFPTLSPTQRYAAVQFIRERFVKVRDPKNYIANDTPEALKAMPAPGAAMSGPAEVTEPQAIEIKAPVQALLSGIAAEQAQEERTDQDWLVLAQHAAAHQDGLSADVAALQVMLRRDGHLLHLLHHAVSSGDKQGFVELLSRSDGSGAVHPHFSLMTGTQLQAFYQLLLQMGSR